MTPDLFGRIESHTGLQEAFAGPEQVPRYDSVPHNLLFVIDIMDKFIQRPNALAETGFQPLPIGRINNAGDQVKGEDVLVTRFRSSHTKRHAQVQDHALGSLLTSLELAF